MGQSVMEKPSFAQFILFIYNLKSIRNIYTTSNSIEKWRIWRQAPTNTRFQRFSRCKTDCIYYGWLLSFVVKTIIQRAISKHTVWLLVWVLSPVYRFCSFASHIFMCLILIYHAMALYQHVQTCSLSSHVYA